MKIKAKTVIFIAIYIVTVIALTLLAIRVGKANGNQTEIVGYIYDSGTTVWSMAERHCPDGMDVRSFAREIERVNNLQNSTVYAHEVYKIPVY